MDAPERDKLGEALSAYLDGEASAEERAALEARLANDPDARALLAELEQAAQAVRDLPRQPAPPMVLQNLSSRLERAALLGDAGRDVTLSRHRARPLRFTVAAAATLVLAVGGVLYVSSRLAQEGSPAGAPVAYAPAEATPSAAAARDRRLVDTQTTETSGGMKEKAESRSRIATLSNAERDKGESLAGKSLTISPATGSSPSPGAAVTDSAPPANSDALDRLFAQLPAPQEDTYAERAAANEPAPPTDTANRAIEDEKRPPSPPDEPIFAGARSLGAASNDGQTLEQKLAAGEPLTVVENHEFAVEPVQLSVTFADARRQADYEVNLVRFLAAERVEPVDRAARLVDVPTFGDTSTTPRQAGQARQSAERQPVYFRGLPARNYARRAASDEQYLLRLPAAQLDELVRLTVNDQPAQVQLSVGSFVVEGPSQVQTLAAALSGTEDEAFTGGEVPATEVPLDVLALLEKAGLAPPAVLQGRGRQPSTVIERRAEAARRSAGREPPSAKDASGALTGEPAAATAAPPAVNDNAAAGPRGRGAAVRSDRRSAGQADTPAAPLLTVVLELRSAPPAPPSPLEPAPASSNGPPAPTP